MAAELSSVSQFRYHYLEMFMMCKHVWQDRAKYLSYEDSCFSEYQDKYPTVPRYQAPRVV